MATFTKLLVERDGKAVDINSLDRGEYEDLLEIMLLLYRAYWEIENNKMTNC